MKCVWLAAATKTAEAEIKWKWKGLGKKLHIWLQINLLNKAVLN